MPVRPLSEALTKRARDEINEKPGRLTEDLVTFKQWAIEHTDVGDVELRNDQWLVAFLRGCKFDMEKAKGKFQKYQTLKDTVPEYFANRDPLDPGIQDLLKIGVFLPLKKCNKDDSPRPCIVRIGPFCKSKSKPLLADFIKVGLMIAEILFLEDDNYTISGEDLIIDLPGIGFRLLFQWTPSLIRKTLSVAEKALSVRMRSFHLLNAPMMLPLNVFKAIAGAKMRERIHLHDTTSESLYTYMDKSILPIEYGGTNGSLQDLTDHWKTKVESYRDWFLRNEVLEN